MFFISDAQQPQQQQLPLSVNYDEIEMHVKDDRMVTASINTQHDHHSDASVLASSPNASSAAVATTVVTSPVTMQPARFQSMVVQNDGTIILCDNDADIVRTRPSRIEVVEIVSPPNYNRGKSSI